MNTTPEVGSVSCQLDWFRYTAMWHIDDLFDFSHMGDLRALQRARELATMPIGVFSPLDEERRPQNGYNRAAGLKAGTLSWHSTKPEQRILMELRGEDLANARTLGLPDEKIIEYCHKRGHRPTRIDCALDWYGEGNPTDLKKQWDIDGLITRSKDVTVVKREVKGQGVQGETVYIGNETSNRRLRVYNKRLQIGTEYPWIRIEATMRDEAAVVAMNTIVSNGIEAATKSLILAMVKAPDLEWWNKAMRTAPIVIEPERRKVTETEAWLRDDVSRVLHRVIHEQADQNNYELFEHYVAILSTVTDLELPKRPKLNRRKSV